MVVVVRMRVLLEREMRKRREWEGVRGVEKGWWFAYAFNSLGVILSHALGLMIADGMGGTGDGRAECVIVQRTA